MFKSLLLEDREKSKKYIGIKEIVVVNLVTIVNSIIVVELIIIIDTIKEIIRKIDSI